MAGIIGFGTYVPRYRLPREVIAKEWGQPSMGGEKAVAGHDEDSLTLAVNAALNALPDGAAAGIDAIYFASTTPPYREKQSAATVAAVLDAGPAVRTADITDSLRAGTSALRAALDAVHRPARARALVCAGDCRMGEPDRTPSRTTATPAPPSCSAAPRAGPGRNRRRLHADRGIPRDLAHRRAGLRARLSRRVRDQVRLRAVRHRRGAGRCSKQTGTDPAAIANGGHRRAATRAPSPASPRRSSSIPSARCRTRCGRWSATPARRSRCCCSPPRWSAPRPASSILLVGYGDGADALLLRTTDAIGQLRDRGQPVLAGRAQAPAGVVRQVCALPQTDQAATATNDDLTTPVVLFRDRRTVLSLHGGRCPACGAVQFPRHRVCIECGQRDGLEEHKLARRGTLFTFTNDYIHDSPDAPTSHGVVELDGGGRVYVQLTDVDPEQVEVDMPVELTFRKYHEGSGMPELFLEGAAGRVSVSVSDRDGAPASR